MSVYFRDFVSDSFVTKEDMGVVHPILDKLVKEAFLANYGVYNGYGYNGYLERVYPIYYIPNFSGFFKAVSKEEALTFSALRKKSCLMKK